VQPSDGIIGAEKTETKMNLQSQAEIEPARRTRSKLEAHREVIFTLRRKHWTYRQIAQWLNEHGVLVTFPSVYRFCERAIGRRPRNSSPLEVEQAAPIFTPTPQPTTNKTTNQHRFNLDI
jgi:IS30 family transposase